MIIAFFECIGIVWMYGTGRLSANIKDMTGEYPNFFFRFCWSIVSPLLIAAIWIFSVIDYKEPTYNGEFPSWAIGLGWCIAMTSLLPIPVWALINIFKTKADSFGQKLWNSCHTTITHCPCGCETGLDDKFEAHGNSQFSLIGECTQKDKNVYEQEV